MTAEELTTSTRLAYSAEDLVFCERPFRGAVSGWVMAGALAGVFVLLGIAAISQAMMGGMPIVFLIGMGLTGAMAKGFFLLNPNEAAVLQLLGKYSGSVRHAGFHWAMPVYSVHKISLRVRNFESARLKVNDQDGNPVEIAAIVVWRVRDTAEAMFEVDNYVKYVQVQTEAALRQLAAGYPYDGHDGEISLRGSMSEVARQLKEQVQDRLFRAGVEVIEARLSHLAYAPEVASAMLRRQQAAAVIAARQKIVEGAVTMVDMAIKMLSEKNVVQMDEKEKAAMVSNLMVVLCAEHTVQPVVNTNSAKKDL